MVPIHPLVAQYLKDTLTQEQFEWLDKDIQSRPLGLPMFAMSDYGKAVVRSLVDAYRKEVEKPTKFPATLGVEVQK